MAKSIWAIDPAHSEVSFKVKHMMFTNVTGKFKEFQVVVENTDDQFESSQISFSANVNSVSTGSEDRDNHLRSADFFDVDEYPKITFTSTGLKRINDGQFQMVGDLTIKEVTKSVVLDVEYSGLMKDPWGNTRIAATLSGKINRKDFGLTWNASLEAGGVLVGEDVKLMAEVQLIKG